MQERYGQAEGPSGGQEEVCILTVPPTGKIAVTLLGPVHGVLTHWHKGASRACPGPEVCLSNIHRERQVWKGYVAAEWISPANQKVWTPTVLEVTENLHEYFGPGPVRGQVWRLWRSAVRNRNVEVRGQMMNARPPGILRTDIDVCAAVRRLYRTLDIAFDVAPPFGSRQRLLPMAVDPNAAAIPLVERPEESKPPTAAELKAFARRGMAAVGALPSGNGKTTSQDRR